MNGTPAAADTGGVAPIVGPAELTARAQIRDAAMRLFATEGVEATSLKRIAEASDKSVGLVQHYFGTKARLVEAINEHALLMLRRFLGDAPLNAPADGDLLDHLGDRFTAFAFAHADIVDYLSRALIHGDELGAAAFDMLYEISETHAKGFEERGMLRPDLDFVPAVMLPLLLRISVFLLRPQVERKLNMPLRSAEGMGRMDAATTQLIRHGLIKP